MNIAPIAIMPQAKNMQKILYYLKKNGSLFSRKLDAEVQAKSSSSEVNPRSFLGLKKVLLKHENLVMKKLSFILTEQSSTKTYFM